MEYQTVSGVIGEVLRIKAEPGIVEAVAKPTVSIIMPAYNAVATIRQSIDSVIAQTYLDWELLVIDDCSCDATVQIVESLADKDKRVRLLINERNAGVSQARNRGVFYAQGEWIAFLDSDDYWDARKLEKQLRFNKEMDAAISYTGTSYVNEDGLISKYVLHAEKELPYAALLKRNVMSCSSVMVRRDVMIHVSFAAGELSEDYAAWMQILGEVGCAYGLDEPLLVYRQSNRSKSASRFRSAKMTFNAYHQVGYSNFFSFLLTLRYSLHSISKHAFIRLGKIRTTIENHRNTNVVVYPHDWYLINGNRLLSTFKSYTYTKFLPHFLPKPPLLTNDTVGLGSSVPVVALICDEMTWHNFRRTQSSVVLSPQNWKELFFIPEKRNIKYLFCEATWSGLFNSCWRGQVYKDRRVFYENRSELLNILAECKNMGISTVFWAKEDPIYFQDSVYDFTDTALRFDYILTTAEECIEKYNALGHKHVYLWPFGFSSSLFHLPNNDSGIREKTAVFAGGWYKEHPRRCSDMITLFDMVLEKGISLQIYDRYRVQGKSRKPFPERYQRYIRDSVPYERLGDIYRQAEYVININTVRDSNTMFARRVYEAMACGCIIISNDSIGMRTQFGNRIWYTGEDFDFEHADEIRNENYNAIFSEHSWERRVNQLITIIKDIEG